MNAVNKTQTLTACAKKSPKDVLQATVENNSSFLLEPTELTKEQLVFLCEQLRNLPELHAKKAIKIAALHAKSTSEVSNEENDEKNNGENNKKSLEELYSRPGDDCAAFKTNDGYQLLAMEGMLPNFVKHDPRAAGWSSVMANVSDIAAMGGRPTAIANAFWHNNSEQSNELIFHIKRACKAFGVIFSGGHSNISYGVSPNLAVAIIGHAKKLLSCYHVKNKQKLFLLTDLTGSWHGDLPYWGCVVGKTQQQIKAQWQVPAELAELELAVAAKDISNGGIFGTLIMMLELTKCGASIDLNKIPLPNNQFNLRWLRAFQSFGFLLTTPKEQSENLKKYFQKSHLTCVEIGEINNSGKIAINSPKASEIFWDLNKEQLTHMGKTN